MIFEEDLERGSRIIAEEVESDISEEDVLADPDLKWTKNNVFFHQIDPDFYDALSRVIAGREQKRDGEILNENWMFVEYIKIGLREKREFPLHCESFHPDDVAILGRIPLSHQGRDLFMELVALRYNNMCGNDSYTRYLIAIRNEREIVHIHMYEELGEIILDSTLPCSNSKIFSYQGDFYTFVKGEIKKIIYDGESIVKIDIFSPEKFLNLRVDFSGDSIISTTFDTIYRLGHLRPEGIEIMMKFRNPHQHLRFLDPLNRIW